MPAPPESCGGGRLIGSVGALRVSASSESQGQTPKGWSPKGWSPNGLKLFFGVVIPFVPDSLTWLSGKAGVAIMDGKKAMKVRRMRIPEIAGRVYIAEILRTGLKFFFQIKKIVMVGQWYQPRDGVGQYHTYVDERYKT